MPDSDSPQPELPIDWPARIPELAGWCDLEIAGLAARVEITREQLSSVYVPLLGHLSDTVDRTPAGRVVAGLAGIPGGGKSTFAAVLAHVADRLIAPGWLAVVPMDGWHWPSAVLDTRTTLDEAGRPVPLRTRKGGPDSFDIDSMIAALRRLQRADGLVLLPAYDRRLHEPLADVIRIEAATRVVLVEGNYVLGGIPGVAAWDEVSELLTPKLHLACDPNVARERVISRHVCGGAQLETAIAKYDTNDRHNVAAVLASAAGADVHINLDPPGVAGLA
jgi:putative kinase